MVQRSKLMVEVLEGRDLLSVGVNLNAGVLAITADDQGDYVVVQQIAGDPNNFNVFAQSGGTGGTTYTFANAQVTQVTFTGGAGTFGDYFQDTVAIPTSAQAGNNPGYNFIQVPTGSTAVGSPNTSAYNYLVGTTNDTMTGGAGFNNIFMGGGGNTINTGPSYNGVYDIIGTNTLNAEHGRGYLITDAASTVNVNANYQVITFFQPGISGNAPGVPGGPSVVLQNDVNGNGILYLNQANNGGNTNFDVSNAHGQLVVHYTDNNTNQTWRFPAHSNIVWLASFGPAGGNNNILNSTSINNVFYGGLPNAANPNPTHVLLGGFGINVLKGHSGTNTESAYGYYNDITAGTGTDNISVNRQPTPESADPIFIHALGITRSNLTKITTTIVDTAHASEVSGVPLSYNGLTDPTGNITPTAADYFWIAQLLRQYNLW